MKHTIVIQVDEKTPGEFHQSTMMRGNIKILSRAVASFLQTDEEFRQIVLNAIANLMKGNVDTEVVEPEDELVKGGKKVG